MRSRRLSAASWPSHVTSRSASPATCSASTGLASTRAMAPASASRARSRAACRSRTSASSFSRARASLAIGPRALSAAVFCSISRAALSRNSTTDAEFWPASRAATWTWSVAISCRRACSLVSSLSASPMSRTPSSRRMFATAEVATRSPSSVPTRPWRRSVRSRSRAWLTRRTVIASERRSFVRRARYTANPSSSRPSRTMGTSGAEMPNRIVAAPATRARPAMTAVPMNGGSGSSGSTAGPMSS